ncbi:MAG: hypothetical protein V3R45_04900, partial [Candidatus Aminicenantaceae bacterium]
PYPAERFKTLSIVMTSKDYATNHALLKNSAGDEGGTPPRRTSVLAPPIPQWVPYAVGRDTPLRPSFISFKKNRIGRNASLTLYLQQSRMDVEKCVSARSFSEEWRHTS